MTGNPRTKAIHIPSVYVRGLKLFLHSREHTAKCTESENGALTKVESSIYVINMVEAFIAGFNYGRNYANKELIK